MHSSSTEFSAPSSRLEQWKYSKVESFLKLEHPLHERDQISAFQDVPSEIAQLVGSKGSSIVFYNGQLVGSISEKIYNVSSPVDFEPLNYLDSINMEQAQDGVYLEIDNDKETVYLNIIHLYGNRIEGTTQPTRINTRNHVKVKGISSAKIFEVHIALNELEFSLNQSSRYEVSDSAKLERVKSFWLGEDSYAYDLEDINVSGTGDFKNLLLQMGGKWSRIEQNAYLLDTETHYKSLGAYLLGGSGHCDMTTNIEHKVGHTNSEQLYKGVVTESSRSAFSGRIVIHQDAQKSSTAQLNQNVILGNRAEADSKPQLEVYADDVTASHGSTIGGLNEDEIFYLRSRGIPKEQAVEMAAKAFVHDLTERLDDENLRAQVARILEPGFARYVQSSLGDY